MREIKFRGKNLDGWFIGNLIKEKYTTRYFIDYEPVETESIGQYTGLKDKNGKEIYEGDIYSIIKYDIDDIGHKEIHTVKFDEILCRFNVNKFDSEAYEVIGNIYDNPELLKEEI